MKPRYNFLYCIFLVLAYSVRAQTPVEFIQNKGQWGDWFLYKAETRGADVLLEKDGFRFVMADRTNNYRLDSFHHGAIKINPTLRFHVYKVTFEGANTAAAVTGHKPQKNYYNYFLGNDSSLWKSGIHPYFDIDYANLYQGVDMHVTSEHGHVVYEFMVKPGANASQVKMKFDGQDNIRLKKEDLIIHTSVGDVMEMKPYVYQNINDSRVMVPCEYVLENNELSFSFPEGYDHEHLLVIDPTIVFSTLTGATADNWGYSATYDNSGNFYAGGLVNCAIYGGHFPVSTGAFQTTWGGGVSTSGYLGYAADISIIKYNTSGSTRIFATYLGGAGNDHVHSMIVDGSGNLVLAGRTHSINFPVTSGCYQSSNAGGWDIIVSKFNSTGTSLIGSTYIGGSGTDGVNYDSTEYYYGQLKHNYGDDSRSEVQIDNSDNVYVAGCTNSSDFPTTSTAISTTLHGAQDGVVFKMNSSLTSLLWSTYLGGNASDAAYSLAFDTLQQYLYVGGGTNSTNFPTTTGAWQASYMGDSADGFVAKFLNSGAYSLTKCTYIGTSGYDQVYGLQVDGGNNLYMMGQSIGGSFPVSSGVYNVPHSTQFIMKMDQNLTTDIISTVYGSGVSSSTNISPVAFLIDTCGNVYVSGWGGNLGLTGGTSGNCVGMPVSSDAYQSTTDGSDFYFIVLSPGMTGLRYATFYGRSCTNPQYGEHVDGGTSRFDKHGIIYQAICASCGGPSGAAGGCTAPFPTTAGAWSTVDSSPNCNEDALKIAFSLGPVHVNIIASPSTSGCAPLTISFTNLTVNGLSFLWQFGDGTPNDTTFSPTHTFANPGTYTVTVSAANSNACFVTNDTLRLTISVDSNGIKPGFTYSVIDSCGPYSVSFNNTSVYSSTAGSTTFTVFHWYFGDGTSYTGSTPPVHNYADTGVYTITLVMIDSTACKSPDTLSQTVTLISTRVSANFNMPDSVCLGTVVTPTSNTVNATSYLWTFADSVTFTTGSPSYTFNTVGTFTVTLIASNPGTCNGADTLTRVITVFPTPEANFSFIPISAEENVPTTFTNLSVNATRYSWDFGDGTSSVEVNPVHQFDKTGTYKTCLTAYNSSNCPSIACKEVPADVVPIIGLPSAFSPNGDGENDILYVRGAAIKTLDLKIYNRWGQLIFETTSQAIGWDGTFNGQPQPIDAYGYVLNVSFIDGSTKLLKGNLTLLR